MPKVPGPCSGSKMMPTVSETARRASPALFEQIEEHLQRDETPSVYLQELARTPAFDAYPLTMLKKLRDTPQSPVHHPEGSVWNHTLLVVDQAAAQKAGSRDPRSFMWAALLHDIGKPDTTRKRGEKITAYNHDNVGAKLAREFLCHWTEDEDFLDKVTQLVRYHMQLLYVNKGLPFMDIDGMKKHTDIREIALLGLCDRLGRKGADPESEKKQVAEFIEKCLSSDRRKGDQWQKQA
jgi:putative nucleotidyltransferase with HDIG domain